MTAIFAFDETDDQLPPRVRRDTASSISSFDARWAKAASLSNDADFNHIPSDDFDSQPHFRHFGIITEEEEALPSRLGTPPIPIPNGNRRHSGQFSSDGDDVPREGMLSRKMKPDDFEQIKVLGKGGYGTVLLVRQKTTGRLFAQKQLKKASLVVQAKIIEYTKSERTILEEIKNPFVVKLFYAFQDSSKLYLILEYAAGGELFHHLDTEKMFSEDVAAFYLAEVLIALTALHSQGVIYRDLKPENCLLDAEGHLLLTDFGLSKVTPLPSPSNDETATEEEETDSRASSMCGTCEYMAPEMIQGRPYGYEVDYWAMGVLLHELLTGSPPFTGPNNRLICDRIIKSKLKLPYYISPDAKDLLTKLLKKVPTARLGCKKGDVAKIRAHRFFRKVDWARLERREVEAPIRPIITDAEKAENFPRFNMLALPGSVGDTSFLANGDVFAENVFTGFTYTASESFIDRFMEMRTGD